MLTSTGSSPASSVSPESADECDFCGRAVHPMTAVERVQRGGDESDVVTLCAECAFGLD